MVEIDAPIDRCYSIIEDLENTPDWQEQMVSIEILERDSEGRATVCEILGDAKVRQVKTKMQFAYQPRTGMSWEQLKGELKSLHGSWSLEPISDHRTRASYKLEGDPGMILGMLLRGPVANKVTEFLTKDPTEGLKRAAEAG